MPTPLESLTPGQRRLRLARSFARVLGATVVLLVIYALVPVAGRSGASVVVRLVIGVLVFGAVIGWQLWSVSTAEHPQLRAVEALAVAFVLLVVGFAYAYLSLSHGDPKNFSEHLNRVGAIYFALTIITTVGFGDIAARTNASHALSSSPNSSSTSSSSSASSAST